MAYKALYRTYRPQTFEEVAGQQHIVKTLKNALTTGKIAHAYLFAGPRGTGKTTMAKLFAKALNCEVGNGEQCNKCKNCVAITEGNHPDVYELDAASNNGVKEIREITEGVKYGTMLGKKKVYIIDEVHMLTEEAFNALLKTLEEPPEHVVFILATTEPHRIIPTILSRCQRYDFSRVSDQDIKERIKIVLEKENIEYNEKAVDLVVSMADGGMRDALSILDQVLAYSGNTLNEDDILNIFSLESKDEKIKLITSIANHNVVDVLERLNNYIAKGSDIKRLTNDILSILKDSLIYSTSRRADFLQNIEKEDAKCIASMLFDDQLLQMIDVLMNTLKDYKSVSDIVPLFEVTLLKLCSINSDNKQRTIAQKEFVEEKPVIKPTIKLVVEEPKPTPIIKEEKKVEVEQPSFFEEQLNDIKLSDTYIYLDNCEKDGKFIINNDLAIKIMVTSKKDIKDKLRANWSNVKKYVSHPLVGKAATLLADSSVFVAGNKVLIIEVPFQKVADNINQANNQLDIQNLVNALFQKKMFVYALSHIDTVNWYNQYKSLQVIDKLPKAKNTVLEFKGE